jgi:predicted ATPase/DNA-binding CsgD family transcriptional regulator
MQMDPGTGHAATAAQRRLARAGVTGRETEVLAALAERLRNREIAGRLHVSVRTVESHVAALLRKLGVADRAALAEIGRQLNQEAPASSALPAPLTSLVGRDADTGQLLALLARHRLVTLTGPAGIGKTRLALQAGTAAAGQFPDGARLADLAPATPDRVGETLARALGVIPQNGWPLRGMLSEAVTRLHGLLLVDNCEHVIASTAELVAELLAAGPQLRVLATSREPLGVPGEATFAVPTLPVPTPAEAIRAATAGRCAAVRLFAERAASAAPGFTLTDDIAPAVSALCLRLDGLPLAIELAAARVRSFGPASLVEHLDQRFELLSDGARTAPPRHRTLRGAIDGSYQLLDQHERALFDRLGAFPASFDYAAAQAVGAAGGPAEPGEPAAPGVLRLLPRLVDKSLVSATAGDQRRYRLLESIREYAAERLAGSGAGPATRHRHAAYYLALAAQADRGLRTPEQARWLSRLTAEQPNLDAALAHFLATGQTGQAWLLIARVARYWEITGQRREAKDWVGRVQAAGDPPASAAVVEGLSAASLVLQPDDTLASFGLAQRAIALAAGMEEPVRAQAELALGVSSVWAQPQEGVPALHRALALFGASRPWDCAVTMHSLTYACASLAEALDWGREAAALFRRVGDPLYAANSLFVMAQRAMVAGRSDDEVHGWLTESHALAVAAGSEAETVHTLVGFSWLAWLREGHERGAALMTECLPALHRAGDRRCLGRALYMIGERAREDQQLARAQELLTGSVEAVAVAGQSLILILALESLAAVRAAQGQPRHAAALLGAAQAARDLPAHLRPSGPPDEDLRRSLVAALGADGFGAAYGAGGALPPAQALRLAPGALLATRA